MGPLAKTGVVPMPTKTELQTLRKKFISGGNNIPYAQLKADAEHNAGSEIYENEMYLVTKKDAYEAGAMLTDKNKAPAAWYLSVKRIDKEPICSWRDIQEIKNQLVGRHNDGFMLYPNEDRVVDTANQYHLFVMKSAGTTIPYGFNIGRHVTDKALIDTAKQTPRRDK